MDYQKLGNLIYRLRTEKKLTQRQLAERMNLSDKTISKWERGLGCPDVSLLPALSEIFQVETGVLLSGDLDENDRLGGNMKHTKFYICPNCGNVINAMADAGVSCCGKGWKTYSQRKQKMEKSFL